ncbi:MAG: hypothetical protein V9H26_27260 [Verrucomicrobiota bacterium]|nr:hypothetical protein [Limisphaerales bacterium]
MNLFRRPSAAWAGLALCVLAGCTTPRIDWAGRVGHYTYDQAVVELGPPDKQATLTDGARVADWLLRRGRNATYSFMGGGYGAPGWPAYAPVYVAPVTPDYYLRLNFGPDEKLTAWKKFAR